MEKLSQPPSTFGTAAVTKAIPMASARKRIGHCGVAAAEGSRTVEEIAGAAAGAAGASAAIDSRRRRRSASMENVSPQCANAMIAGTIAITIE